MDSILELQRRAHEELERVEQAIVEERVTKPKGHKEKLIQDHRVNQFLERIQTRSQYLLDLYKDEDGSRKADIRAITGASDFTEFYARLKDIKDYHRRSPNVPVEPMEMEFQHRDPEREEAALENMFSGEEGLGRYLDLHASFEQYVNLKDVNKVNYLKYLDIFDKFDTVPMDTKRTAPYQAYLEDLQKYLEGFCSRTQPLFDLTKVRKDVVQGFNADWEIGSVRGWSRATYDEQDDEAAELFCLPCEKQFTKKTVYTAHLTGKKHTRAAAALLAKGVTSITPTLRSASRHETLLAAHNKMKPIALAERLIKDLARILSAQRDDTREHVERKQTLTTDELVADANNEDDDNVVQELDEEEEEEEEKIYNPLKLPLGWDGKPIPYWLYKLHGLGVEYPCEICGNYVYMGRKAFDRHFQEWRHAHGMRCLGIPNTRHFHEITLIEDAYALWERLKSGSKSEQFKADAMEEFEDADGNVFNKKTYDDLKRQGLL
ncbi:hypothetical protein PhCBS80983_g04335 [Powellomyces hirtus]|uniref:Matrin-type domain-containing protein n=1 Tax=Powellomyces hirtus TaxID=109895 RepID=A0A507DYU9_9FUNG|nr:hypothetical protein PhCBS80983_g04335 [Powellomyces hirtus]